MKTRTVALTVGIGLGLLGLTVLQARPPEPRAATTPQRPTAPGRVAAEGRVAAYPGGEVLVSAERAGRLVRMAVVEGQSVKRGELIAEIDSEELTAALAEQHARLRETEAERRLAQATLERRLALRSEGIATVEGVDEAERDLAASAARHETVRAAVARVGAELAKTRVHAPLSGTVTIRHADAGERVEAGAPLATIADLGHLRVDAEADEADAGTLHTGADAEITADGFPGQRWRGRVEEIGDAVRPRRLRPEDPGRPTDTRVLPVKVAFVGPHPLKLGTTVEVRIAPGR